MTKVAVSILEIKNNLSETIKKLDKTDADYLHIDIMDGKFVPNHSFAFSDIEKLNKYTMKKLDIHLMVKEPKKYIEKYATLDAEYISIHYEIGKNLEPLLDQIKECGIKCGLSLKPKTSIKHIIPLLKKLDLVLLMSVNPGKGGQSFLPSTLDKIARLKKEIDKLDKKIMIAIDGGIDKEKAKACVIMGADLLVSGTYVLNSDNYQEKINDLRNN